VVTKISQRVIRKLRQLGYLEPGLDATMATGYDPWVDDGPEWARTLSASVQQRIAFGERAAQKVRRMGSGVGSEGERPPLSGTRCASLQGFSHHANPHLPAHRRDPLERLLRYTARGARSLERLAQDEGGDLLYTFTQGGSEGTRGIRLSPLERFEQLAALVPPPRVHPGRYAGGLAAHRQLRGAMTPTLRQPGIEVQPRPASSRWVWARRLNRVLSIDLERGPHGHPGALRLIAALTSGAVLRRLLSPLQRAPDPPPLTPARLEPGRFAGAAV
jgi:Putative transposase